MLRAGVALLAAAARPAAAANPTSPPGVHFEYVGCYQDVGNSQRMLDGLNLEGEANSRTDNSNHGYNSLSGDATYDSLWGFTADPPANNNGLDCILMCAIRKHWSVTDKTDVNGYAYAAITQKMTAGGSSTTNRCFCGDEANRLVASQKRDDTTCSKQCGDASEFADGGLSGAITTTCGAEDADNLISVYRIAPTWFSSSRIQSLGCFKDTVTMSGVAINSADFGDAAQRVQWNNIPLTAGNAKWNGLAAGDSSIAWCYNHCVYTEGKKYAAVFFSDYCFCSDSYSTNSDSCQAPDAACSQACPTLGEDSSVGDNVDGRRCGAFNYNSIYGPADETPAVKPICSFKSEYSQAVAASVHLEQWERVCPSIPPAAYHGAEYPGTGSYDSRNAVAFRYNAGQPGKQTRCSDYCDSLQNGATCTDAAGMGGARGNPNKQCTNTVPSDWNVQDNCNAKYQNMVCVCTGFVVTPSPTRGTTPSPTSSTPSPTGSPTASTPSPTGSPTASTPSPTGSPTSSTPSPTGSNTGSCTEESFKEADGDPAPGLDGVALNTLEDCKQACLDSAQCYAYWWEPPALGGPSCFGKLQGAQLLATSDDYKAGICTGGATGSPTSSTPSPTSSTPAPQTTPVLGPDETNAPTGQPTMPIPEPEWTTQMCDRPVPDARCCNGWRPECHVSCVHACVVYATECTNETQEWTVNCEDSSALDLVAKEILDSESPLQTAARPASLVSIEDVSGTVSGQLNQGVNPHNTQFLKLVVAINALVDAECTATFNNATWVQELRNKIARIVHMSDEQVAFMTPDECNNETLWLNSSSRGMSALGVHNLSAGDTYNGTHIIFANLTVILGDTLSPTEAPTPVGASGDPFTTFRGKQTQFYLPLPVGGRRPQPSSLITCGAVELRGEAFGSGIPGDSQQWFRRFVVVHGGHELLSVGVRDVRDLVDAPSSGGAGSLSAAAAARHRAAQLLADAAAAQAATEKSDVTVAEIVESRVNAALQAMHWAETSRSAWKQGSASQARALGTLNVTLMGRELRHTGAETVGVGKGNEAFAAITQDTNVRIGAGYAETVSLGAGNVGVEFTSSVAQKFSGKQSILKTHVDMRFTQLEVAECRGPLPEIWGVQPMTKTTAMMLVPPKV